MSLFNVFTVKTGERYIPDYVNKMYAMLQRHLRVPFLMHCITENPTDIHYDIEIIPPPEVLHGWWNKMYLFSDIIPAGPTLYLDLDQIILGDITEIIQDCFKHPFACYSDHIEWHGCKFGSGLMTFQAHQHLQIFKDYWPKRYELTNFPGGDQVYLGTQLKDVYFLDDDCPDAVKSYKFDVIPNGIGENTKIVNFHGLPKPHNLRLPWVLEHWCE